MGDENVSDLPTHRGTPRRADQVVIAAALLIPSVVTWVYFVWLAKGTSSWQQLAYAIGKTCQFALPVIWVTLAQRDRVEFKPISLRGWQLGVVFGLTVVGAMLVLYYGLLKPQGWFDTATAQIMAKVQGFGVASPLSYAGLAGFYALVHSGLEEYYWRWFVFGQLRRHQPFVTAACISSLGFMAHHVILLAFYFGWTSPLTYVFSASVAVGGLFWAWLYERHPDHLHVLG